MPLSSVVGAQSIVKPGVCTSSTRPASPFEGQMIYETDTDKVLVYNGSAWYANWNTAWGKVAYVSSSTAQSSVSTAQDITGMSVTFTAVAGRHYRFELFLPQLNGTVVGDRARIDIVDASNNSIQIGYMNVSAYGSIVSLSCLATASGSVTYKGVMRRDVGSGTIASYADSFAIRYLLVEDIGPA
jgi:hypothetical protein